MLSVAILSVIMLIVAAPLQPFDLFLYQEIENEKRCYQPIMIVFIILFITCYYGWA